MCVCGHPAVSEDTSQQFTNYIDANNCIGAINNNNNNNNNINNIAPVALIIRIFL